VGSYVVIDGFYLFRRIGNLACLVGNVRCVFVLVLTYLLSMFLNTIKIMGKYSGFTLCWELGKYFAEFY